VRSDSVRAELRSAAKFFLLPDCWFLFYTQARHRVTRLTSLADVPIAQTFSYSISYDTCRGHAAFTLFFVRGLLPGLSGAVKPVLSRASFRKIAGVSWSRKIYCVRSIASQGDAANEGPSLTLQALVPADALFSQR
jgi:hypothetical protein